MDEEKFLVLVGKNDLETFSDLLKRRKILHDVVFSDDEFAEVLIKRRKKFDKSLICRLYSECKSYSQVAKIVGCSKSYVEKVWQEI